MQNDWLSDDEYPDEADIEAFGDDSQPDYDPLTIGYLGESPPPFWTNRRISVLVLVVIMIGALLVPLLYLVLR